VNEALGTLRVKRGAEVVPAAAAVENRQSRYFCCQFGLTCTFEKLPQLGPFTSAQFFAGDIG
jgi:hypothetical protein